MRIVIATDLYYPQTNGVAVFAKNLAEGLAKKGHRVMVVCPSFKGRKHIVQKQNLRIVHLTSARFPFYPDQIKPVPEKSKFLYRHGLWFAVNANHQVKKALDWFQPDVIHIQTNEPIALAARSYAESRNVPLVTTGHTYPDQITDHLALLKPIKKQADAVVRAFLVSFMKHAEYNTMPTQIAIDNLINSGKGKEKRFFPIEAISNGIDLSAFKPGKASNAIYKKYKIPDNKKLVLHVGRIDPDKSIDNVIDAFYEVLVKVPEAVLLIVGDGTSKTELTKRVHSLGIEKSVLFLGRILQPDLSEIYKTADVFVTASEIETQGIVLLEAAAIGLPIVAVDKNAVPDVVEDGKNGFLAKPGGDIYGLAKGMIRILSNDALASKFSKYSLEVAKKHDLSNTITKFIEIYEEAIRLKGFRKKRNWFFRRRI